MNWYKFIFSDTTSVRIKRHLLFWVLWWGYFIITYFHYQQTGLQKIEYESWSVAFFIKCLLVLSVHILSCYWFIYFLLPRYFLKGKYYTAVAGSLFLCAFILFATYYLHKEIFPLLNVILNYQPKIYSTNIWWTSISSGLFSAPKVIAGATAIKLLKRWYLTQKEKDKLEKEKLITDLQLLKAQIHPEFLFTTLDSVYTFALKDTRRAAVLLLKLSDLLSYILYDCDKSFVYLAKEIKMIKEFMALEQARLGSRIEMDIAVKGDVGNKMIPPLLLIPFIENSFSYCSDKDLETCWINLEIRIENNELSMKLINGKTAGTEFHSIDDSLTNVQKRLNIIYDRNYELKFSLEPEIVMTNLKIHLYEKAGSGNSSNYLHQNEYAEA